MKKFLTLVIILAFLSLVGWQVYKKMTASPTRFERERRAVPVAVEVMPVKQTTILDIGYFTGTLYPKSEYIVAPKVGGRLERLYVDIGDRVKRGQLIARLEDAEYLQQVDQAQAELEVARAKIEETRSNLGIAEREFKRAKTLREKKIASQSELETAEAQFKAQSAMLKVAKAQLSQQEAALRASQVRLSYTQIKASWEGGDDFRVVGERFVHEGTMLAPNASIVSILEIGVLTAVVHVIERDYSKIVIGQEAVVTTDAYPGRRFFGKVVRIAPLLRQTSREARIEIEVPNPDQSLRPGMYLRIQIEFEKHQEAIVVPMPALVKRQGQEGVFVVDSDKRLARFIPVTVGIANDHWVEVMEPPLTGLVVTLGQHLLSDGSPVILPDSGPGKAPSDKSGAEFPGKDGGRPGPGERP
jgi:RND family efflux transporter MFP subunit